MNFLLGETYGATDWRELRKQIGLVSSSVRQMMAGRRTGPGDRRQRQIRDDRFLGADEPHRPRRGVKVVAADRMRGIWRSARGVFLSQGERQRVLIGRALMAQPPVADSG